MEPIDSTQKKIIQVSMLDIIRPSRRFSQEFDLFTWLECRHANKWAYTSAYSLVTEERKVARVLHPAHRKASPRLQLPQLLVLPCTVKSSSSSPRTTTGSFLAFASSDSSSSFNPHVQSLHAFRRFPGAGAHSMG
jgi:hypothetical protein